MLLAVGEGVFGWGGFWVLLFLLPLELGSSYWIGFFVGLFVSQLTASPLGLVSCLVILTMFVYSRMANQVKTNPVVLFLFAAAVNLLADRLAGSGWGQVEIVATGILVLIMRSLGYLKEELRLRS